MRFTSTVTSLASLIAICALGAGCSVATSEDANATGEDAEELVNEGAAPLVGTFKDDSGSFHKLVLSDKSFRNGNKFTADVSTGIVCVVAPCPSAAHIEGWFTAGSKTITLRADEPGFAEHLLGKYRWQLQGDKLTLTRAGFQQSLAKIADKLDNTCVSLSQTECSSAPSCEPVFGPSHCSPTGVCTRDILFKGCFEKAPLACEALDQDACATAGCEPTFGPSSCAGNRCTRDFVFKGCQTPEVVLKKVCLSSGSCAADEFCSTERGTCNATGMLAVCSGTCDKGARASL